MLRNHSHANIITSAMVVYDWYMSDLSNGSVFSG